MSAKKRKPRFTKEERAAMAAEREALEAQKLRQQAHDAFELKKQAAIFTLAEKIFSGRAATWLPNVGHEEVQKAVRAAISSARQFIEIAGAN